MAHSTVIFLLLDILVILSGTETLINPGPVTMDQSFWKNVPESHWLPYLERYSPFERSHRLHSHNVNN
jgi:hypothetical protein